MSDMKRLTDGPLPASIAAMLQSADADAPSAARSKEDRILAALGAAQTTSPEPTRALAWSTTMRNVAWIGLAAIVTTIGAAGLAARTSGTSTTSNGGTEGPSAAAPTTEESAASTPSMMATTQAALPTAAPSIRVDELPSVESVPSRTAKTAPARPRDSASGSSGSSAPSVESELAVIDAARAALSSNRPGEALSQVHAYRSNFRAPHFGDEADALEVQALAALGRTDEARAKADAFVARHPNSPYAQRVRSAVGTRE